MVKRRLWIILAAVGTASGLSACWGFGSLMVRPSPSPVAPALAPARDLTIESIDGLGLAATYWPGRTRSSPGILILHGNGSSRSATRGNAEWLAGHGFAVLTVDFRGCGESAGAPRSFGLYESRDARAAFDWLKRRQNRAPVAVIGLSLGGAAALLGEDGPLRAEAMILQAVYPDIRRAIHNRIAETAGNGSAWLLEPLLSLQTRPRFGVWPSRLSPLAALGNHRGAVLVIGGAADRSTPLAETRAMFAAARGPKSLWIAPNADHRAATSLRNGEYRQSLLAFLRVHIGAPGETRAEARTGPASSPNPSPERGGLRSR